MPYQQNIPQPTDLLSKSQGDLLNNFQSINTLVNVNHVTFDTADQGKHKWVTFPVQGAIPPAGAGFLAGEIGLYNATNATTTVNELYINKTNTVPTVIQVPMTASILSTNAAPGNQTDGWSYLPSGLIIKWGSATNLGNTSFLFPVAATIPVFTRCLTVQLTTQSGLAGDVNTFVRLQNMTAVGFTYYAGQRTVLGVPAVCSLQYLAIGY